jgi:hypothetical protein
MLPIVVNGRLVFVPFDADAPVASGLDALLDELATTGATGDSAPAASERVQKRGSTPDASSDIWQTVTAPLLTAAINAYGNDYACARAVYQRLRLLDDCLAVHQTADVAELRHDIRTACAAS